MVLSLLWFGFIFIGMPFKHFAAIQAEIVENISSAQLELVKKPDDSFLKSNLELWSNRLKEHHFKILIDDWYIMIGAAIIPIVIGFFGTMLLAFTLKWVIEGFRGRNE